MTHLKDQWILVLFTLGYILGFGGYYVRAGNAEFLWYVAVIVLIVGLVAVTLPRLKFPSWLLWLLTIWGLIHMAGGGLLVAGEALYRYQIVHLFGSGDSFVLKFDQVVHMYGFFVATLVMWYLVRPVTVRPYSIPVLLTVLFAGMGLGALNEMVEFFAVVFAPETGVGGYFNTSLDLVANALGATAAIFAIRLSQSKRT